MIAHTLAVIMITAAFGPVITNAPPRKVQQPNHPQPQPLPAKLCPSPIEVTLDERQHVFEPQSLSRTIIRTRWLDTRGFGRRVVNEAPDAAPFGVSEPFEIPITECYAVITGVPEAAAREAVLQFLQLAATDIRENARQDFEPTRFVTSTVPTHRNIGSSVSGTLRPRTQLLVYPTVGMLDQRATFHYWDRVRLVRVSCGCGDACHGPEWSFRRDGPHQGVIVGSVMAQGVGLGVEPATPLDSED